jgi:hypothetical protein
MRLRVGQSVQIRTFGSVCYGKVLAVRPRQCRVHLDSGSVVTADRRRLGPDRRRQSAKSNKEKR